MKLTFTMFQFRTKARNYRILYVMLIFLLIKLLKIKYMQKIIEIPNSIQELFENGEKSYRMIDYSKDMEMDNNQSMEWFIENVPIPYENIADESGTQIIVELNGKELCIDAGGLGDCFSHEFVVTECCTHELVELGTCAGCGKVFN